MFNWLKRSIAAGLYHQIKLNGILQDKIGLLEKQINMLKQMNEHLENEMKTENNI
ncbi:hypothetical protein M3664_04425 [Paenibacillus lautus]|uniref:hypothetical protein n=1 Tax=Paenibacillus lautus TaxID=1401 RepID=UPI00203D6548|nr:hypothetical protein [Paenibacillus lautus]MCM3257026.1 hypothetical protein [Paenibacillus lautus]